MTCYYPLKAWQLSQGGKPYFSDRPQNPSDRSIQFACGQCSGCRLERSRQWAIRCVHESSLYTSNCFITLTYDDNHYPQYGSLNKKHFQNFMKRLRRYVERTTKEKIRYFHCGEYGSKLQRPHYHAIIFNYDFADKVLYSETEGVRLYISDTLSDLWGNGFCTIGDVTFDSAAYVAGYIMKKQKISKASPEHVKRHYEIVDPYTGEIHELLPEYTSMSLKPGIGADWYEKYWEDVFPSDEVVIDGRVMRTPAYYDKLYDVYEPDKLKEVKENRIERARLDRANATPERLKVRETVLKAKLNLKNRNYEK